MATQGKSELNDKLVETAVICNSDSFNFERWVKEVRPQLMAALRRRGSVAM
jgi:hypothetical protein